MVLDEVGRHRPGHRVARRLRRARHAALLRMAARAGAAGRPSAGAGRAALARGPGAAAADLLPPVVHRPHAHRRRLRRAPAEAEHRARGDRRRRHQDLRARSAWASASSPRSRCATSRRAATWCARPAGHLFGQNVTRIAFKRGAYLRNFVYAFAEMLSDRLTPLAGRARDGRRRRRTTSSERSHRPRRRRDARRREPPAAGRHHHLHRDVGAGAGARRGQPRPGLPRLRLRPAAARRGRPRRCAAASTSTRRWPACRRCARRSPRRSKRCTAAATTRRARSPSPPARRRRS